MAGPYIPDGVCESTTSTGTGAVTLAGAVSPYLTFGSALADGDTVYYAIKHRTANEIEWGVGTYDTTGPTLTRTDAGVIGGTGGAGSRVNFSAGTKDVYCSPLASMSATPGSVAPGGRLTTETGVAVSTSDRTAQGTVHYTPYLSDYVRLYDGVRVREYSFAERSLALSGLTSGKNYDVFLYDNAGTLTLELSAAWTTDTAQADAVVWQAGLGWVKSGSPTRLWIGTVRADGTNTVADSRGGTTTNVGGKRFVWNLYNRVRRTLAVIDTADNWTYNSATWRRARATDGNKVEYVCGLAGDDVKAKVLCSILHSSTANAGIAGVGVDRTNGNDAPILVEPTASATARIPSVVEYVGNPGAGYHYLAWVEYARVGTATFEGDFGSGITQSGLVAEVFA